MPQPIGTLLHNRYRIERTLGQGGMGAVYRALDEHLNIKVAVKENLFLTEEYGRQFKSEATILAGLRHPNLPHVSDYFILENQGQYLVMDYVEGEDLRERMERMGALPEREAILIGISICDALTYLHTRRQSVIHRDIKPGNIKVTPDGQAVLVDFGLAKIMQGSQVTSTGARAMTPGYSPPEQYGTARTDHRSDIYSLGATLYAALTAVIPEDGLARMTGKAKLTPIRDLAPKVNRKLADCIERALEIDPDDRFQTADEFKRSLIESGELASFYQERPTIPPPPLVKPANGEPSPALPGDMLEKPSARSRLSRKRQRQLLGWAILPAIGLLALGAYLLFTFNPQFNHAVMAYLAPAAQPTQPATQVASAQTNLPTDSPDTLPGKTPQPPENPAQVEGKALTATVQPTAELTATAAPSQEASPTPRGGGIGQIAFASDKGGGNLMQIYLLDVRTKKTQQMTGLKDGACQPAWSPDGSKLAFISPCISKQDSYQGSNIYTINVDPGGRADRDSITQITTSLEGDYDPAWSPDGKRIAFTSLRNDRSSIWVLNLVDGQVKELSLPNSIDKHPSWSPDGFQLVFVRQFLTSQIWIMNDNGDVQNQFSAQGPVNNIWPVWSPDGQIVFFSQVSSDAVPTLFYKRMEDRYKLDSSLETRITNPRADIGPVAQVNPSPDGFWLAFEGWAQGANHDIYIMNINGANKERLTDLGFDFGPVWRPIQAPTISQP